MTICVASLATNIIAIVMFVIAILLPLILYTLKLRHVLNKNLTQKIIAIAVTAALVLVLFAAAAAVSYLSFYYIDCPYIFNGGTGK